MVTVFGNLLGSSQDKFEGQMVFTSKKPGQVSRNYLTTLNCKSISAILKELNYMLCVHM